MRLAVYAETIDPTDYYLVGIDTAASTSGALCAIEIFTFRKFEQVAEAFGRIGSLTKFAEIAKSAVRWLLSHTKNVVVGIERNSIGQAIVESFTEEEDLEPLLYYEEKQKQRIYGIQTTAATKGLMTSLFYQLVCDNPSIIKSEDLKSQLLNARRNTRGDIEIPKKYKSDLFMASCFCAYVRKMWYHRLISVVDIKEGEKLAEIIHKTPIIPKVQTSRQSTKRLFSDLDSETLSRIYQKEEESQEKFLIIP